MPGPLSRNSARTWPLWFETRTFNVPPGQFLKWHLRVVDDVQEHLLELMGIRLRPVGQVPGLVPR